MANYEIMPVACPVESRKITRELVTLLARLEMRSTASILELAIRRYAAQSPSFSRYLQLPPSRYRKNPPADTLCHHESCARRIAFE